MNKKLAKIFRRKPFTHHYFFGTITSSEGERLSSSSQNKQELIRKYVDPLGEGVTNSEARKRRQEYIQRITSSERSGPTPGQGRDSNDSVNILTPEAYKQKAHVARLTAERDAALAQVAAVAALADEWDGTATTDQVAGSDYADELRATLDSPDPAAHDAQVRAEERELVEAEIADVIQGIINPEFGTIWREGDGEAWLAIQQAVADERERIAQAIEEVDPIEWALSGAHAGSDAARIARSGGAS